MSATVREKNTWVQREKNTLNVHKGRNAIALITWKTARGSARARDTCQEPFCRQSLLERGRTKRERRKVLLSTFILPPRNFWCALGCSQGTVTTRRVASRHDVVPARVRRCFLILLSSPTHVRDSIRTSRAKWPRSWELAYAPGTVVADSYSGSLALRKSVTVTFVAYNLLSFRLNLERLAMNTHWYLEREVSRRRCIQHRGKGGWLAATAAGAMCARRIMEN